MNDNFQDIVNEVIGKSRQSALFHLHTGPFRGAFVLLTRESHLDDPSDPVILVRGPVLRPGEPASVDFSDSLWPIDDKSSLIQYFKKQKATLVSECAQGKWVRYFNLPSPAKNESNSDWVDISIPIHLFDYIYDFKSQFDAILALKQTLKSMQIIKRVDNLEVLVDDFLFALSKHLLKGGYSMTFVPKSSQLLWVPDDYLGSDELDAKSLVDEIDLIKLKTKSIAQLIKQDTNGPTYLSDLTKFELEEILYPKAVLNIKGGVAKTFTSFSLKEFSQWKNVNTVHARENFEKLLGTYLDALSQMKLVITPVTGRTIEHLVV